MLAKQLDDALCSGSTGDWRSRGGKCASCQALGGMARTTVSLTNGPGETESQPMSLLAELEQAEAANSQVIGQSATPPVSSSQMIDVDLTKHRSNDSVDFDQSDVDVERWAARLCDVLERQRHSNTDSRPLELSADTRYRLLKLIGSGMTDDGVGGKLATAVDLAELVRNRDGRVAELTCEVRSINFTFSYARRDSQCLPNRWSFPSPTLDP